MKNHEPACDTAETPPNRCAARNNPALHAMNKPLLFVAAASVAAWGMAALSTTPPANAQPLWLARQHVLHLSGLLAVAFMSLAMLASARPAWLQKLAGGAGPLHLIHRRAGIIGTLLALAHWLTEKSGGLIRFMVGRDGKPANEKLEGLAGALRHAAKDAGEWALWLVLIVVAITLWRLLPQQRWRLLHRTMPLLYAGLVFHALLLAPRGWWTQGSGFLLLIVAGGGLYGAARSLQARFALGTVPLGR